MRRECNDVARSGYCKYTDGCIFECPIKGINTSVELSHSC